MDIKELEQEAKEIEVKKQKQDTVMLKNFDNINVTDTVQKSIKKYLLKSNDGVNTNYDKFLERFFETAMEDPNSKAGQILANAMVNENILEELDKAVNDSMNKNIDFMEYRIIKTLFDKQREVYLDDLIRRKAIICSRRAGKTELACRLLLKTCISKPGSHCYYINLTFGNAIKQTFDIIIKIAEYIGLPIERESKNDGEIKFSNGSEIHFRGNNNIAEREKIQGFKARLVIIDEAQTQKGLQYLTETMVAPLLMDYTDSILILQGTPPRVPKTYFEKVYNQWSKNSDGESKSYHWTMVDNPYIKNVEEEIEKECKRKGVTRDNSLIQREYLGNMVFDTEAQVYSNFKTYDNIPDTFKPTHISIGVDWGSADSTAIISLAYNVDTKEAFVINEDRFNRQTSSFAIDRARLAYDEAIEFGQKRNPNFNRNNVELFCDSNEGMLVYELNQTYKLPAYNCYKYNKMFVISVIADYVRSGRMQIPKDGILQDEMEQIVYKRDEEDVILNELDEDAYHGNAVDALRYAFRQMTYNFGEDTGGVSTDYKENNETRKLEVTNGFDLGLDTIDAEVIDDNLSSGVTWLD